MKKNITLLFLTAFAAIVLTSCNGSLPARIDKLAGHVEKNWDIFSAEDWQQADAEYEKLAQEYRYNGSQYKPDRRSQIRAGMAKYECIRFDSFMRFVEKNSSQFSEDEWSRANSYFRKLLTDYHDNSDCFNTDQKRHIRAAMVRYVKIVTKSRVSSAIDMVKEIVKELIDN